MQSEQDIVKMITDHASTAGASAGTILGIKYYMLDPYKNYPVAATVVAGSLMYFMTCGVPLIGLYLSSLFSQVNEILSALALLTSIVGGVFSTIVVIRKLWPKKKKTTRRFPRRNQAGRK